jgi:hypothetical protein
VATPRPAWALVAYLLVVAVGTVGILLTTHDNGAGSGLVATWLAFSGLGGLLSAQQAGTHEKVQQVLNGTMEAKIRTVVGQELAAYATDPGGYVTRVDNQRAAEARAKILGRAAAARAQGPPKATPRAPAHRKAAGS